MATYKLMQDIEAEDHILGPLTLRQFIFALIAGFLGYLCFVVVTHHAAFLLVLFAPPALFCAFFAFPFGKDQPTEVWFLAKLRYWFLPRKRLWDQSGVKELVTITAPKKIERVLTNGLDQTEVKSRLQALANTLDSRGWVVKNVNNYSQATALAGDADRLIDLSSIPQEVPNDDVTVDNDILDTVNNPVAYKMGAMVDRSTQVHHQQLMERLSSAEQPRQATSNWFMAGSAAPLASLAPIAPPMQYAVPAPATPSVNVPQPLATTPASATSAPVTTPSDPAILALASNDDLNVATLAREANKAKDAGQSPNEVVISLR